MEYVFKTETTMKPYNYRKWWIDRGIVKTKRIVASTLKEALNAYREQVNNEYGVEISKTAIENGEPMYIDTDNGEIKQIGLVFTASTEMFDETRNIWVKQFVDLWTEILTVIDTDFNGYRG